MDTPICDFVRRYAEGNGLRLHMPGHKGKSILGLEHLDITEIDGADSLYEADGIIHHSENNASKLFGFPTFYSTEGSSQCIRAMVYLAMLHAKQRGRKPLIAAGRNVHKTFLSAVALLDLDVLWLHPAQMESYLSCNLTGEELDRFFQDAPEKPSAVYLTSPDYLGNLLDVASLAVVCHRYGAILLVDNAHGAYLKFLEESLHPMDLGADLCCDSAHKTLPVLTGGAYLHIADDALAYQAKNALALFGSTSPSYLILQSLDAVNPYLAGHRQRLKQFVPAVAEMKKRLERHGYRLYGNEPLKLTVAAKDYGYTGTELAAILLHRGLVCEFSDPDYLVLMLTPETDVDGLRRLEEVLLTIPRKPEIGDAPPVFYSGKRILSVREAMLSPAEMIPVSQSKGRILAAATVGCPPAVPILICGEEIDEHAISCFQYYGIESCLVMCR